MKIKKRNKYARPIVNFFSMLTMPLLAWFILGISGSIVRYAWLWLITIISLLIIWVIINYKIVKK